MVLPTASLAVTARRAEEIRAGLSKLKLEEHAGEHVPTVSVGVAAFPDHGTDADSVLRAADRGLYHAKKEGRDRVCIAALDAMNPERKGLSDQNSSPSSD